MEIAAWIVSIVLGAVFTLSGVAKSVLSRDRLIATGQTGIAPFPMPVVRVTAVAELLEISSVTRRRGNPVLVANPGTSSRPH